MPRNPILASGSVVALMASLSGVDAWTFAKTGHNPSSSQIEVGGVGAGPFDPSKIANWRRDSRAPLIAPNSGGSCPGNIYAANAVNNGGSVNVYFGGWDGVSSCHDSVSVAVTEDDFQSFNAHASVIATGSEMHVNNPSALKRPDDGSWAMLYTQLPTTAPLNKPGFSTSEDGVVWTPGAGGAAQLVQVGAKAHFVHVMYAWRSLIFVRLVCVRSCPFIGVDVRLRQLGRRRCQWWQCHRLF